MSEYRPDWWPPDTTIGVLDMALALHMSHTGASDPLPDSTEALYLKCLNWLRDNWNTTGESMFDRAVLTLINRTIAERRSSPDGPPDLICSR